MIESATPPEAACISCGGGPILVKKRQLCRPCYCRWQRYGDPGGGGLRQGMSPLERFNHYVPNRSGPLACWLWTGPTLGREVCDYGRLWIGSDSQPVLAHRWAYEHFVEPIPDGLEIDHVKERGCQSTLCCNPTHLQPVPHKINVERGESPSAQHGRKDCCPQCGGPYTAYEAGRRCLPCYNARMREWMLETGRTIEPDGRTEHKPGGGKGARQRERTHCSKGHEYTEANTYIRPATGRQPGGRDCKICRCDRRNKSAAKMRALKRAA